MKKILTRRHASKLALSSALPFGILGGQNARAEKKKAIKDSSKEDSKVHIAEFLFVQNAKKVSFADGKITMRGINPTTIFFSDRPDRIAGHETTADFVNEWDDGAESFKIVNPNAALAFVNSDEEMVDLVVVLSNPVLAKNSLTYDIKILDGKVPESGEGGACTLFIDVVGRPVTPASGAGVARRTSRRVVRRRT